MSEATTQDTWPEPGTEPALGRGSRTPATSGPLSPLGLMNQERLKWKFTCSTHRKTQQGTQASLGRSRKDKAHSFEKTTRERGLQSKHAPLNPGAHTPAGQATEYSSVWIPKHRPAGDDSGRTESSIPGAKDPDLQKGGHWRVRRVSGATRRLCGHQRCSRLHLQTRARISGGTSDSCAASMALFPTPAGVESQNLNFPPFLKSGDK